MMIVSLSEYPSTVRSPATTVSEISRCISLRNAIVVKTSWLVAMTAAVAKRHSNRIERYTSVMRNDSRIAMIAPRFSSVSTRGPTPSGTHHLQIVLPELLLQYPLDRDGDTLGALRLRGDRGRILRPHRELAVRPELLDLG